MCCDAYALGPFGVENGSMIYSKEFLLFQGTLHRSIAQRLYDAANGRITPHAVLELVLAEIMLKEAQVVWTAGGNLVASAEAAWQGVLAILASYERRIDLFNEVLHEYGVTDRDVARAWVGQQDLGKIRKILARIPGWEAS